MANWSEKAIAMVKVGDEVLSHGGVPDKVLAIWFAERRGMHCLGFGKREHLWITSDQPIFVGNGELAAMDLERAAIFLSGKYATILIEPGAIVMREIGRATVRGITSINDAERPMCYALRLNRHMFFANGFLVHGFNIPDRVFRD